MSDPDFWTRVTTPTEDEVRAAWNEPSHDPVAQIRAVLALAAPRIVAEAYREAARRISGALASDCYCNNCEQARKLLRMATEAEQRNRGDASKRHD